MKAEKTLWFSTLKGQIGIVLAVDDHGNKKALLGNPTSGGTNEAYDIQEILDYGAKLNLFQVLEVVNHLIENPLLDEEEILSFTEMKDRYYELTSKPKKK